MEHYQYTRPREKLRDRGVSSLSSAELLQVIIGSGNRHYSAARIAKTVVSELERAEGALPYSALLKVVGVGHAKACQILAAVELGKRQKGATKTTAPIYDEFNELKTSTKRFLLYVTYDGEGTAISRHIENAKNSQVTLAAVKKMCARALGEGAHSLLVGIGSKTQSIATLDEEVLTIIKKTFETTDLLEIRLKAVWMVSQTLSRAVYRKEIG